VLENTSSANPKPGESLRLGDEKGPAKIHVLLYRFFSQCFQHCFQENFSGATGCVWGMKKDQQKFTFCFTVLPAKFGLKKIRTYTIRAIDQPIWLAIHLPQPFCAIHLAGYACAKADHFSVFSCRCCDRGAPTRRRARPPAIAGGEARFPGWRKRDRVAAGDVRSVLHRELRLRRHDDS
jgi:hypothetical protein